MNIKNILFVIVITNSIGITSVFADQRWCKSNWNRSYYKQGCPPGNGLEKCAIANCMAFES